MTSSLTRSRQIDMATLIIVLLRSPRTVGRVTPPVDDASRVPGELDEM
jgi:hypothetical protein